MQKKWPEIKVVGKAADPSSGEFCQSLKALIQNRFVDINALKMSAFFVPYCYPAAEKEYHHDSPRIQR